MVGDRANEARIVNASGYIDAYLGLYKNALVQHERSRRISHEIGDPHQESHALQNLCTVNMKLGKLGIARANGEQAAAIARDHHLVEAESNALNHLGYVLIALGEWSEAANAFQRAVKGWSTVGHEVLAIEARAGLAEAALGQRDLVQAQQHIEIVLNYLADHSLHGADEPFRVYLTCFKVLQANGDGRAQRLLARGHKLLQVVAAKITEASLRNSFLENVAVNRIITRTFENIKS